jgi:CheY-like chemotaxis protein
MFHVQFSSVRPWRTVRLSSRFSTAQNFRTLVAISVASALLTATITSLVFHFGRNGGAVLLLALAGLAALPVLREARRTRSAPWVQLAQTAKSVAPFQDRSLRPGAAGAGESGAAERDGDPERRREALENELCARNAELRTLKEELREANRRVEAACCAQGQALASTCHQIRTRMNGILGMTELVLETALTLEQRDCLLTAKRSAESLLTTLDGMLGVPENALPPPSPARWNGSSPAGMHVLVVEDHAVGQHLVGMFLAKHGHRARVVANGREALEALARDSFDAILMDIQMPVMNGFEATSAIRRGERESGRHIPIVAMTAFAMKGARERCLESGMDAYVSKPIRPDALMEALDRACALDAPARRPLAS